MGMAEEEEEAGTMVGWLVEEEKEGYEKKIAVRRRLREFQLRERESGEGEGRADKKASGGLGGPIKGLQHFEAPRSRMGWSTHGTPATYFDSLWS